MHAIVENVDFSLFMSLDAFLLVYMLTFLSSFLDIYPS